MRRATCNGRCDVRCGPAGRIRIFPATVASPAPSSVCPVFSAGSEQGLWEALLLSRSGRGLLDVLAVLDPAGQLCVESGVSGAATCSGKRRSREETRLGAETELQVLGTVLRCTVEPSSGGQPSRMTMSNSQISKSRSYQISCETPRDSKADGKMRISKNQDSS